MHHVIVNSNSFNTKVPFFPSQSLRSSNKIYRFTSLYNIENFLPSYRIGVISIKY